MVILRFRIAINRRDAEKTHDDDFTRYDLKKIRELAALYYATSQTAERIKIGKKYSFLFAEDYEFSLLTALCYEKIGDSEKACEYAGKVLELNGSLGLAIEILDRNRNVE